MGVRRHGQSMPLGKGEEEKEKASFSSSSFDTPTTGNRREMEREAAGWPSRTGYGRNITINPWGHYDTNNLHAWARIRRRKRHSSPPHPSLLQPRRRSGATTLSLGLRTLRRRTMPRRQTQQPICGERRCGQFTRMNEDDEEKEKASFSSPSFDTMYNHRNKR